MYSYYVQRDGHSFFHTFILFNKQYLNATERAQYNLARFTTNGLVESRVLTASNVHKTSAGVFHPRLRFHKR